jgi:nitroreductase
MREDMTEPGIFKILYSTRSMRRLRPDPIPEETLKKIIDAGIHAPSGSDFQAWAFLVVQELADKRFIRDRYWRVYQDLERLSGIPDLSTLPTARRRMFAAASELAEHLDEVPAILLACSHTDFPTYTPTRHQRAITATLHASIYPAVQNILLACRALGIGATLTTVHYFFEEELKREFGIPEEMEIAALLPLGFPRGKFGPTTRRPVEEVLHWGRWGAKRT